MSIADQFNVRSQMDARRSSRPWPPSVADAAVDVTANLGLKLLSAGEEVDYLLQLAQVAVADVEGLTVARRSYGDSWRKRGGVGAFMMLARKWDRLETLLERPKGYDKYDVVGAIERECAGEGAQGGEAVLDAVRDLRRYLLLVETYVHGRMPMPMSRDNIEAQRIAAAGHAPDPVSPGVVVADAAPVAA